MIRRLSLALLCCTTPALAAPFQDTTLLDKAVAGFTGRAVGEDGGARAPVDTRLKLATCPMLALSWRTDKQDAVVVNCPTPMWRIFVPVRAAAAAPVTTSALAPAPAVTASAPKAPPIIRRGDAVTVTVDADGFSITRDGIAVGDAPEGGRLPVKVEDNKPTIQAVAVAPGKAVLPGYE